MAPKHRPPNSRAASQPSVKPGRGRPGQHSASLGKPPRGPNAQNKHNITKRTAFSDRHKAGHFDQLTAGQFAGKLKLSQQYDARKKGDVARRMGMQKHVDRAVRSGHLAGSGKAYRPGNHSPGRQVHGPAYRTASNAAHHIRGKVSPHFAAGCFKYNYYGHHRYAGTHWYPSWTSWVSWSWHHNCNPYWDPRPVWCRPVIYASHSNWSWWHSPAWTPLPVVNYGTWVDVPQVATEDFDLQLLAIRFVDPGHPDEKLGPRYRVWFRNNSNRPIVQPFNVMLFTSNDANLVEGLPQAGVRVTAIEAGDVQSVDIRLPLEVYGMGRDADGQPTPFGVLHALVDVEREISDSLRTNNGTKIARADIPPVDPAAFAAEPSTVPAAGELLIAGEGLGPQPGKVLVNIAGLELEGEILGWYDLGVRVKLPHLPLVKPTEAELVVIRGDGTAANPLKITVGPPRVVAEEAVPQLVPPSMQ